MEISNIDEVKCAHYPEYLLSTGRMSPQALHSLDVYRFSSKGSRELATAHRIDVVGLFQNTLHVISMRGEGCWAQLTTRGCPIGYCVLDDVLSEVVTRVHTIGGGHT